MGVKYLTTFAKTEHNSYVEINILNEIREFRAKRKKNAVIIFDVMGFIHNFGDTNIELSLGGRRHIYLRIFERFIRELNEAGAFLAFFCDGQLQSDRNAVWCDRRDTEFQTSFQMISNMTGGEEPKQRFGCKSIVQSLFKLIEDKHYGKIVISTHVDCDSAIAKYAFENDALAVIASDSDFLIFEGSFQWWVVNSLRMQLMTVKCFYRNELMKSLQLASHQMKYLATIAGNDYTKHLTKNPNFRKIANFCRKLGPNYNQEICRQIAKYMTYETNQEVMDCIDISVKSYDINFHVPAQDPDKMNEFCASNVLLYAFRTGKVFQYEVNFLDFNQRDVMKRETSNSYTILDAFLMVFRKLGGILLKSNSVQNPVLKIFTKYSLYEKYTLKEHVPIYPADNVDIEELLFECDDQEENKWKLLLWCLRMNPQIQFELQKLPNQYVMTLLALIFLYQENEITTMMADALLLTHYNILESNPNLDEIVLDASMCVNKESIWIVQLFNRTITLIWDCLTVCGLKRFIQLNWYDGPYFNEVFTLFKQLDHSEYNQLIEPISGYRLYATSVPKNATFQFSKDDE